MTLMGFSWLPRTPWKKTLQNVPIDISRGVRFLYVLTQTFMVLHGTITVYGLEYGFHDTMSFIFFQVSWRVFIHSECNAWYFKSFLNKVDFFSWSTIWLPVYHTLHIWPGYGFQERLMVVKTGLLSVRLGCFRIKAKRGFLGYFLSNYYQLID